MSSFGCQSQQIYDIRPSLYWSYQNYGNPTEGAKSWGISATAKYSDWKAHLGDRMRQAKKTSRHDKLTILQFALHDILFQLFVKVVFGCQSSYLLQYDRLSNKFSPFFCFFCCRLFIMSLSPVPNIAPYPKPHVFYYKNYIIYISFFYLEFYLKLL